MEKTYQVPKYYEIAFSFMNVKKHIDNFEKIIKKYSKRKVHRFLDIACGPSLQLREIARRGYEAVGLDASKEMLSYLKSEAREKNLEIELIRGDYTNFKLKRKADYAFIMLGSLIVDSNEKFLGHLDSVASSLNKGGLYFIQNNIFNCSNLGDKTSWTEKKDNIKIKTIYEGKMINPLRQIYREKIILNVDDSGKKKKYSHERNFKVIFPEEFKMLIRYNNKFEFLGYFKGTANSWNLKKPLIDRIPSLNMTLLRRK